MKHKQLIISIAVTVIEFVVFLVWGLNMNAGDEMGFGLITTYFLFPVTTLVLSAYLAHKNIYYVIPFAAVMFAAQNFMPFFVFGSFEAALILCLSLIPVLIGTAIGIGIRKIRK